MAQKLAQDLQNPRGKAAAPKRATATRPTIA